MNLPQKADTQSRRGSQGGVRWWIVWTLFLSTVINYISRQTFSVLGRVIKLVICVGLFAK
jgi:ACS family hexuronate transporter-like MFS transporter